MKHRQHQKSKHIYYPRSSLWPSVISPFSPSYLLSNCLLPVIVGELAFSGILCKWIMKHAFWFLPALPHCAQLFWDSSVFLPALPHCAQLSALMVPPFYRSVVIRCARLPLLFTRSLIDQNLDCGQFCVLCFSCKSAAGSRDLTDSGSAGRRHIMFGSSQSQSQPQVLNASIC